MTAAIFSAFTILVIIAVIFLANEYYDRYQAIAPRVSWITTNINPIYGTWGPIDAFRDECSHWGRPAVLNIAAGGHARWDIPRGIVIEVVDKPIYVDTPFAHCAPLTYTFRLGKPANRAILERLQAPHTHFSWSDGNLRIIGPSRAFILAMRYTLDEFWAAESPEATFDNAVLMKTFNEINSSPATQQQFEKHYLK